MFKPADTIDDVIAILEKIITGSIQSKSRAGYFASLYLKVTASVKGGIAQNRFRDGPRMEQLDVIFANRYLEAYYQWQHKEKPTASWELAFREIEKSCSLEAADRSGCGRFRGVRL